MILIDYSQISVAAAHQQLKKLSPPPTIQYSATTGEAEIVESPPVLQPNVLRLMILNSIRKANREFGKEYGQIVVCTDHSDYWRRNYFEHYKANRKKTREESDMDWDLFYEILAVLREEIRTTFPYKVMNVALAEADDIIGIIAKHFHQREKILILSGDHDFQQLQVYPNIVQYSPSQDKYIVQPDPARFLLEHIIRGDRNDGVPNFLSNDDVFVSGGRQSSIFDAKVEVWVTQKPEEFCTDERLLQNYVRNQQLVDLNMIPGDVEQAILKEFENPIQGNRSKIYPYLVKHRMANLLDLIRDF